MAGRGVPEDPYRIERPDDEPFAFAGLWETWGENGDELHTCTLITTEPNAVMESIHDRMPVILEDDEEENWLDAEDPEVAKSLLDPDPDGETEAYEITRAVNDSSNDSPSIVEPVGHGQSGLEEF